MFLVSRTDYKDMVTTKKPQLANFYSNVRKSFKIFVKDNKPIGDKWSFDEDNRKRVPKGYQSPKSYTFESKYFEEIKKLIDMYKLIGYKCELISAKYRLSCSLKFVKNLQKNC